MPHRFELVSDCPHCSGLVTVENGTGTFSGRLRYLSFDEFQAHREIIWGTCDGESFALLADLVDLGVLCTAQLRIAVLETEEGSVVPVGAVGGMVVNRAPLLDALRRQLPRRWLPHPPAGAAEHSPEPA